MKRQGFTLIELLVAIGIIMLLAGLILVGLNAARGRARELEAQSMMNQIETSWTAYLADYHVFPFSGGGNVIRDSDIHMLALSADDLDEYTTEGQTYREMNPKAVRYFDIHPRATGVRDPWGNFYQIAFDMDNSGTVVVPAVGGNETVRKSVAVWSMGPDGESGTEDDVISWRSLN